MNFTSMPKVSVMVPVYNAEEFIAECVDSILSQDYPNFQVILCDDCSVDNTKNILLKYSFDERVKLNFNKENLGATANCKKALALCDGDFVCFFAGDDVMLPGKISQQVRLMSEHPDASMSYHQVSILDHKSKKIIKVTEQTRSIHSFFDLLEKNGLPGANSVMARVSMIPSSGFNEKLPFVSDWLMFLELSLRGKIVFLQQPLAIYRKHPKGLSANADAYVTETLLTIDLICSRFGSNKYIKKSCRKALTRFLLGSFARAIYKSDFSLMKTVSLMFIKNKNYFFGICSLLYLKLMSRLFFINKVTLFIAEKLRERL